MLSSIADASDVAYAALNPRYRVGIAPEAVVHVAVPSKRDAHPTGEAHRVTA
jgi:hypothetical protein